MRDASISPELQCCLHNGLCVSSPEASISMAKAVGPRTAPPGVRTNEPSVLQFTFSSLFLAGRSFPAKSPSCKAGEQASRLGGEVNIRGIPVYRNQSRGESVSFRGNADKIVTCCSDAGKAKITKGVCDCVRFDACLFPGRSIRF